MIAVGLPVQDTIYFPPTPAPIILQLLTLDGRLEGSIHCSQKGKKYTCLKTHTQTHTHTGEVQKAHHWDEEEEGGAAEWTRVPPGPTRR